MKSIAIITSVYLGFFVSSTVTAKQSELTQEIKPIECVYTTTEDGTGTTTNSTCENQPIPIVTKIIVNKGRPVLKGEYSSLRAISLRVWLNGQWFTLGIDSRLTTDADEWSLDLSNLNQPLQSGLYTVIVEVETSDGLLLRNTNAATFIVPVRPQDPVVPGPTPAPTPGGVNQPGVFQPGVPGVVIPTILPRTQEAAGLPGGRAPVLPGVNDGHSHDAIDRVDENMTFGLFSVLLVGLIGTALWLIRWWRLRH